MIASLVDAPPVYDPGGLTCIVDDFVVADSEEWQSLGGDLLRAASRQAQARGAAQTVVVCGHQDQPKRSMLSSLGFSIASEWYVKGVS